MSEQIEQYTRENGLLNGDVLLLFENKLIFHEVQSTTIQPILHPLDQFSAFAFIAEQIICTHNQLRISIV